MHSVINKLDKVRLVFRGKASVSAPVSYTHLTLPTNVAV